MASNLDGTEKISDEQDQDDATLEAIASLDERAGRSSAGEATPSKDDFELLSDGESIEVLEVAADGHDVPLSEAKEEAESNVTGEDEVTDIMEALVALFYSVEEEQQTSDVVVAKEVSILNALYVEEDRLLEQDGQNLGAAVETTNETNVSASVQISTPEDTFTQTPGGAVHFKSSNGLEFITLVPTLPLMVSQLKCSARIFHDGMQIRVHNEGCIFLIDDSFMAKVELMHAVPVLNAGHFVQAKNALFRQLCIRQIFVDEVMATRDRQRAELLATIVRIQKRDSTEAMQLFSVVQRSTNCNYIDFCELLYCSKATPNVLREQAIKLLEIEETTERRNRFLLHFHIRFDNSTQELKTTLKEFSAAVVMNRAKSLLDMAPDCLREKLKDVPQRSVFVMHDNDVTLFHDLDQVLNREIFQKPLDDLAGRWINRVKLLKHNEEIVSIVNPIYFSLCRSLEELILEIVDQTDHNPEELLLSDRTGWHAMKTPIRWKLETSLTKCLQREYFFVVRLLKHFDPASGNREPFEHKLRRLLGGTDRESMLGNLLRRLTGQPKQNPLGIADEFYVWLCLLDDVLHHVLPDNNHGLNIFEQILRNFVQLLSNATFEQMEMVRVITHSIGRFIVQIFLFVSSDKAQSYEDQQILQAQLSAINRTMLGAESTKFFRDLIDVFSSYWKNRCGIIENIPSKNALVEMEQIKKTLLAIVVVALRKNVAAEHVINLFRCLNDFIVDLDDVCFDWLIKYLPEKVMKTVIAAELIEPVDNKWSGTENQTYRVAEPVKFQGILQVLLEGATFPKHYILEVVSTLLGCIHSQLELARWTSNEALSESDQIVSSSVLISSIRSTLIYLREQEEYVSFDVFLEERINPFCKVVENCPSLRDFVKRVGMIKESFCYMRKQNEMSITEALCLYGELNDEGDYDRQRLRQAYQQYCDHFETYIAETVPEDDLNRKVSVVSELLQEYVRPILFKEWTSEFKCKDLPRILAGVSAVWSTMVSTDVSSTGKFFKPHCIQILCVLKLLGVDSGEKGVSKHLAQVLTGQGKSLVLALITVVLALTGHQIQVVCYNEYLVNRDERDFADLFKVLGVKDAIRYGTFEDMANKIIAPEVDGKPMGLRSLVSDLVLSNSENRRPLTPNTKVQDNSVLLMDEVDVFFTKKYYGSVYRPTTLPFVPGLCAIQKEIWNIVNNFGKQNVEEVTDLIQAYISSQRFVRKAKFYEFLNQSTNYELLVPDGVNYVRKTYTNKRLFTEQLETMITDAISIASHPSFYDCYKINHEGIITCKVDGKYVRNTFDDYLSVYNYMRLKKDNFVPFVSNGYNYGYLNIPCGSLSYAMLPKAYPLILGVTGTLTSLNQYEKAAINRLYNINRISIMPSFFGCSNLQYNSEQNFTHLATKSLWMGKIFTKANAEVGANRAVIIFFQNDTLLEEFRAQYCGQFDRMQILTENTEENKHGHLIGEAGVAKTVTLATRGMGRGVDYKSSVAVEKNGGVHVIQSFFSLDVKEETQIRGRTARKDNRGSYELIVFDEHLKLHRLIEEGQLEVTYAKLDETRSEIALKENKDIEDSIEKNTEDHLTTLAYLQSFFE